MAQLRQYEALDDLDRDLDLRLVARLHHTGGEHNAAVVVGEVLVRPVDARLVARWLRDRPTSPRSPWQNGYAERLIGSVRRECVDHIIVLGERHLRHVLLSYMK